MCTGLEAIALAGLISGSAVSIKQSKTSEKARKDALSLETPGLPDPNAIKDQARKDAQRRFAGRTKTILTSSAGIIDEPQPKARTILGG